MAGQKHTTFANEPTPKKRLILNAFVETCELGSSTDALISTLMGILKGSGHQSPGLWRHPHDKSTNFNSIQHWVDLAKLLEAGHFQGMFIADVYAELLKSLSDMRS